MRWNETLNRRIIVICGIGSVIFSAGYYWVQFKRDPDEHVARALLLRFAGNPIRAQTEDGKALSLPAASLKLIAASCERLSSYGVPSASRTATRQPDYRCTGTYRGADRLMYQSTVMVRFVGYNQPFPTVRGFIQMPTR